MSVTQTAPLAATGSRTSFWRKNQRKLAPWLFLAPGVLMFTIYVVMPIFQSMWLSFYDWDGLGEKTWLGLGNYVELFDDEAFYTSLKNNVIWLVLYLLAMPAGLMIAIFLNQTVTGIRLYKSLVLLPLRDSQVVVGLIFSWFYAPDFGPFYKLIELITGTGIAMLADRSYVTYGIIAAGLWPQIAYVMILYLTGLNNVAPDQIEAARLDGAKGWRMLWYVILPQLAPGNLHRRGRDRHRRAALVRSRLDHDRRRALRLQPRAVLLHVRAGAVANTATAWAMARRSRWCCSLS